MALQPASGARDLNPQQVEINHTLASRLSDLYRLWGYEQIDPPKIERLETLMADGGISSKKILRVVSDEPLGLRPEMTASIVRGASTKYASKLRPLRLWSLGTVFKCRDKVEGGTDIEESLESGVELIGIEGISAEIELLSLLLEAYDQLDLHQENNSILLIGHTSLMQILLSKFKEFDNDEIKSILSNFDLISLNRLNIDKSDRDILKNLMYTRGEPLKVINLLKKYYPEDKLLNYLLNLFNIISPLATKHNIQIQLDPSFKTNYEMYTGLFFQLVYRSSDSPNVIASGGRYDKLVQKFSKNQDNNFGAGFTFSIDKIRELKKDIKISKSPQKRMLIAYQEDVKIDKILERQRFWHKKGVVSFIDNSPSSNKASATKRQIQFGCSHFEWIQK